jgi:glycine/D-amino acid oxidase-like deaminating enzyme
MAKLRLGTSYWLDCVEYAPRVRPALRHNLEADVAIVGGGVTGCAVAYCLAQSRARVVLLEANRIGRGSTAASTALLMQEPDVDFTDLAARYGEASARTIWSAGGRAVTDMQRTLRALHIDANGHELPSVCIAHDADEVAALRREQQKRRAARFPARWLTPRAISDLTGIRAGGAILTLGNGQVDPCKTSLGLAAAAETHAARIFERSPVSRMRHDGRGVTIHVGKSRVAASWGVVATGYATPEFKPIAARFRMMNTYVIATPPLPATARRSLGLGDVMLWDRARPYHYLRWTPDNRLLFGGADRPHEPGSRRSVLRTKAQELVRDLCGLYPALAGVDAAYAWEGLFAATPDGLPYIGTHRRYPRHLFALGYGGNGMTFGFMAARMLARAVDGISRPEDRLFSFGRTRQLQPRRRDQGPVLFKSSIA